MFTNFIGSSGKFAYPYPIDYSCRFNFADTAYTTRVWTGAGNQRLWSFSTWFKLGNQVATDGYETLWSGGASGATGSAFYIVGQKLSLGINNGSGGQHTTDAVLRDSSSWYHVLAVYDSENGTANDRIRIYINGVEAVKNVVGAVPLNYDGYINTNGGRHAVGCFYNSVYSGEFDGYMAETHFIDGAAKTPSDFGETKNGIWVPKAYASTYGDEGFYLDYSNSSDFGEDQSGNGNDFTDVNLATNDQVLDTPTENYCVMNVVEPTSVSSANGNLECTASLSSDWHGMNGTMAVSSGKWYWEVDVIDTPYTMIGIIPIEETAAALADFPGISSGQGYGYLHTGSKYPGGVAYGDAYNSGETIGVALDLDAGTLHFYNENVDQGEAFSGISGTFLPSIAVYTTSNQLNMNFGQLGFTYTPPNGYKALNWTNVTVAMQLQESLYLEGNKGFDTITYTGTGVELVETGLEFSPDLVWQKTRDTTAHGHALFDTVRGATNGLVSEDVFAEFTEAQTLKSFDAKGYTLGTNLLVNASGEEKVTWNWLEDPNYGFDIVGYEGTGVARTVAHNLGVVPEMMIVKNRESATNWCVYHKDNTAAPETDFLKLNLTDATTDASTLWNDTAPTSSVFTVGTGGAVNENLKDHIAYLFASVEGFSKVFGYTGNGSADGPFVYCGFRPRFILTKNADYGSSGWWLTDTERDPDNECDQRLQADVASIEDGSNGFDALSNGFKVRATSTGINQSGSTMVGVAFAETPFPWSNAR